MSTFQTVLGVILFSSMSVILSLFIAKEHSECCICDDGVNAFFYSIFVCAIIGFLIFVPFEYLEHLEYHDHDCQCIGCEPHANDCQCNECVIDRCEAINHGDTCQCDKCIACKDIGGN